MNDVVRLSPNSNKHAIPAYSSHIPLFMEHRRSFSSRDMAMTLGTLMYSETLKKYFELAPSVVHSASLHV